MGKEHKEYGEHRSNGELAGCSPVFLVFIGDSMNLEWLPAALIVMLVCFVSAAGFWYLAIRFPRSQLKVFALAIVAMPVLGFGLQICSRVFGWAEPPDLVTYTPGPSSREASAIREFPFPVPNPEFPHQIERTPRANSGQNPAASIPLHFIVRTPKGDVLAGKQATPAQGAAAFASEIPTRGSG